MNVLALFAGICGFERGIRGAIPEARVVCYVEQDEYCVEVIRARIRDGLLDDAPIWGDVCSFDGHPWAGSVDCVCGGFPCQDVSLAGRGEGLGGARSGLWWEMLRVIREVGPRLIFVENVPGLLTRGLGDVLGSLAEVGYDASWRCLSAQAVGAPHKRERVWVVAHPILGSDRCEVIGREVDGKEAK